MLTLNKAKLETKLFIKFAIIAVAGLISVSVLIGLFSSIKDGLFPTPLPPPQASFGKLKEIPLPNNLENKKLNYSIDTISGFLPKNFPRLIKVYKINSSKPDLLAFKKAQEKVAQIGFTSKGTQISDNVYQWVDKLSPQRKITINIFSSDFTLFSPFLLDANTQTLTDSADVSNAIEKARSFLSSVAFFPADIDSDKTKATFHIITNGTLLPTTTVSKTQIVKVDFFQKDIDKIPIVYEKGSTSTMNALVGKEESQLKVVEAHFFYKNISQESSTYTIKTADQAFSDLKQGKGNIASLTQNTTNVSIKNAFLGYFIGEGSQDFLMPVVVFQGDNDFLAYVSAVRDEWINN